MSASDIVNAADVETPKSSQGGFRLPCGYLAPDGVLHRDIVVREMTGAEQDLLGSRNMSPFKKYNELIVRCTSKIGTISDKRALDSIIKSLPIGDRLYLIIAIRRVTIGDNYSFDLKCPNESCGTTRNYTIDLRELDIKAMPSPMKRIYDIQLPSGKPARFRISTGEDEERAMQLDKAKDDNKITKGILMRLELLNNAPPTLDDILNLGWKDCLALRDAWDEVEGGVDTEIDVQCPVCGESFKTELSMGSDFFFPSRASKTSKVTSST